MIRREWGYWFEARKVIVITWHLIFSGSFFVFGRYKTPKVKNEKIFRFYLLENESLLCLGPHVRENDSLLCLWPENENFFCFWPSDQEVFFLPMLHWDFSVMIDSFYKNKLQPSNILQWLYRVSENRGSGSSMIL